MDLVDKLSWSSVEDFLLILLKTWKEEVDNDDSYYDDAGVDGDRDGYGPGRHHNYI